MLNCQCHPQPRPTPLSYRPLAGHPPQARQTLAHQPLPVTPCKAGLRQRERLGRCQAAATEETETSGAPEALSQSLRIKLKSFDIGLLDLSVQEIMQVANSTGANPGKGPAYLPTKLRRWCVLRSPHVNKTSREHFEIRTHQRIMEIKSLTADTIDALMGLDLPAGVDVEVKI